jgi:hypothetical protein
MTLPLLVTAIVVCSLFNAYKRPRRVVRASDRQCISRYSLAWDRSQHPPTQWNLRGGRRSRVEKSTLKIIKNSPVNLFLKNIFKLSLVYNLRSSVQ